MTKIKPTNGIITCMFGYGNHALQRVSHARVEVLQKF
jgi:hypothetical protein